MTKLLISGYIGFDNSGDESILYAIKQFIDQEADIELMALSKNPTATTNQLHIKSFYYMSIKEILKALAQTDILISGGGNLLQDGTSSKSLYYYGLLIICAKCMGKKIMIYANGIGPLKPGFNEWFAKSVIKLANTITVRESLSYEWLNKWHMPKSKIHLTADPVFTLEKQVANQNNKRTEYQLPLDKKIIGISLRDHKSTVKMIALLTEMSQMILKEMPICFVLIPMQHTRDYPVLHILSNQMGGEIKLIDQQLSHDQMIELIQSVDLIIGMRLHALIYSSMCAVPFVGLSYEPKVTYFTKMLESPCYDVHEHIDCSAFTEVIMECLNHLEAHSQRIKQILPQVVEAAELNNVLLKQLINTIE